MGKSKRLEIFHKDTISSAAELLFDQQGIEKTTVDQIAKAAEYSKATLYVYFKNKQEIVHYIIWKSMLTLQEEYCRVLSEPCGAEQQYFLLCRTLADFYEKHPFQFQSMTTSIDTSAQSRSGSGVLEEIYQAGEALNDACLRFVMSGIEEGIFRRDISPLQLVFLHWSALSGIITMANQKNAYIEERMQTEKRAFMEQGFRMLFQSMLKKE